MESLIIHAAIGSKKLPDPSINQRLKFSPSLTLNKLKRFETASYGKIFHGQDLQALDDRPKF